jgi:hypothetical protein
MNVSPRGLRAFRSRPASRRQRTDMVVLNRPGFVGGSNFQIGWSRYEQDDQQVFP